MTYQQKFNNLRKAFSTEDNGLADWLVTPDFKACKTMHELIVLWSTKVNCTIADCIPADINPLDAMVQFEQLYHRRHIYEDLP